jgi:fibronectin type 3 domain-containing protein
LIVLIVAFSGCEKQLVTPEKPKIDTSLPVIDAQYLKSIPDVKAVALEWKAIPQVGVAGYNIIRADLQQGGKFKRVAIIKNKYATHYTDEDLIPNNRYAYKVSLLMENGVESVPSKSVEVTTLPNIKSVSLIQTISNLPRQIKILWRPHPSPRIEKYIIQRSTPTQSKWETIKRVKNRLNVEYIDTDLNDNETFMYRIKVRTFDNITSEPSEISTATTKPLPGQIKKLIATQNLPRKIQLSWAPSPSEDVVAYNIYRATSANGSYSKIAQVSAQNERYDDIIDKDGEIFFYKITSVDKDKLETDIKEVNPALGSTLASPKTPRVTLAQIQGNKMILNWLAADDRAVSYNVYKKTKTGWTTSKEKRISNIQALRFEDPDVVRGVEYTYALQAVDAHGLVSEKTEEIRAYLPKLEAQEQ